MKINSENKQISFGARFFAKRVIIDRAIPSAKGGFKDSPLKTGDYNIVYQAGRILGDDRLSRLFAKINNWLIKTKFGLEEAISMSNGDKMLIVKNPFYHNLSTDVAKVRINHYINKLNAPNAVVRIKKGVVPKGNITAKQIIEI